RRRGVVEETGLQRSAQTGRRPGRLARRGIADREIDVSKIVMYATEWCPYCRRAEQLLKTKGVEFDKIRVDLQPELRQEMQRRSGRTSVPQIWIGERHIGGYDDMAALDREGGLDPLLAELKNS